MNCAVVTVTNIYTLRARIFSLFVIQKRSILNAESTYTNDCCFLSLTTDLKYMGTIGYLILRVAKYGAFFISDFILLLRKRP